MQVHPSAPTGTVPVPDTAEEAVMSTLLTLGRRMRQRQPGDEIDNSVFPILKSLSIHGPMRLSALAALLELDASTVSRHARHLEDRGLLERSADPDDGRATRVGVSASGTDCLQKGMEVRRGLIRTAIEDWSQEDRDALRDLLHRLQLDILNSPIHPPHPQENQ
jgi:DNA-binding MarR family transcriptional regulator